MKGLAWVDGRVADLMDARVPLTDRGFLLGDGVFETMRARNGKIFRLDRHMHRLQHGAQSIGIDQASAAEAQNAAQELATAARAMGEQQYLRVQLVRDAKATNAQDAAGIVTGLVRTLVGYPDSVYEQGIVAGLASWRKDRADPLAQVKHLSYLPYLMTRRQASRQGWGDALIANDAQRLCEASHANVVAVAGGTVYSPGPDEGALDGVTRAVLLDHIRRAGMPVRERLRLDAISNLDELMLVNTVGGVVPVARWDGGRKARFAGAAGAVFSRLRSAYSELVGADSQGDP